MSKNKCRQIFVSYRYTRGYIDWGFGSMIATQAKYKPITKFVLDELVEEIRRQENFDDDTSIMVIGFCRFEEEVEYWKEKDE